MKRRALPLAAVALAGLLLGLWLAWPQPPVVRPTRTAPRALSAARPPPQADPVVDTAAPDTPTPAPAAATPATATPATAPGPVAPSALVDALDLRTVRCHATGAVISTARVSLQPSPELMSLVTDLSGHEDFDPNTVARGLFGMLPPATLSPPPERATQAGQDIIFQAPREAQAAFLQGQQRDGGVFFEQIVITWPARQGTAREGRAAEGHCTEDLVLVPVLQVDISGRVQGLVDNEQAYVSACQTGTALTQADGHFSLTTRAQAGFCRVTAWRRDGALRAYSDFEDLDIDPKGQTHFDGILLTMPADDIGGMGAGIAATQNGIVLMGVIEDGPGARAGLQDGDVVTAVNGESLVGMELDDAVATITGPVGSTASLTVQGRDGGVRQVDVQRDWISQEDAER